MTRSEFIDIASEEGWDRAVAQCNIETNDRNLKVLCSIYYKAYSTDDYQETSDPDVGLCYDIREFVMDKIEENLSEEE